MVEGGGWERPRQGKVANGGGRRVKATKVGDGERIVKVTSSILSTTSAP